MKTKTFGQSPLLEAKTIISYSIMETSTQGCTKTMMLVLVLGLVSGGGRGSASLSAPPAASPICIMPAIPRSSTTT